MTITADPVDDIKILTLEEVMPTSKSIENRFNFLAFEDDIDAINLLRSENRRLGIKDLKGLVETDSGTLAFLPLIVRPPVHGAQASVLYWRTYPGKMRIQDRDYVWVGSHTGARVVIYKST